MKLYYFESWCKDTYRVSEIEVEEKPKTYIARGKYTQSRIAKDDINKLGRFDDMYCLTSDPTIYIDAMITRCEARVQHVQERLKTDEENLKKWLEIKGGAVNG